MKIVGIVLFILLLVPIYVLPWVAGLGTAVAAMEAADAAVDAREIDQELVDSTTTVVTGIWVTEAICYALLLATPLIFARGARWTAALIAFAAAFDLLPFLDFVPLVPTVMFVVAFVFMAKARPPESGGTQAST